MAAIRPKRDLKILCKSSDTLQCEKPGTFMGGGAKYKGHKALVSERIL